MVLPLPCVCQKTPRRPRSSGGASRSSSRRVRALLTPRYWWLRGDQLDETAGPLLEDDEVFEDVEQAAGLAHAAQHGFEGDDAVLALAVDLLPVEEMLPLGGDGAGAGLAAVGEDDEAVGIEDVADSVAVVGQVVIIGVLDAGRRNLEFEQDDRQAVDKADDVGPAQVHVAADPDLLSGQKIVIVRIVPIDGSGNVGNDRAVVLADLDRDAVADECVDIGVGANRVHGRTVAGDLLDGCIDGFGGKFGFSFSGSDFIGLSR